MLRAIFGSGEPASGVPLGADGKPLELTPASFDAAFPDADSRQVRFKR